jgi:hypothetical protein
VLAQHTETQHRSILTRDVSISSPQTRGFRVDHAFCSLRGLRSNQVERDPGRAWATPAARKSWSDEGLKAHHQLEMDEDECLKTFDIPGCKIFAFARPLTHLSVGFFIMSPSSTKETLPSTDPVVYDVHHQTFSAAPLPKNETEWVVRAARVAAILAEDVTVRDREQKIPAAEVSLLKSSGLLKVLGPTKYGGGGQPWDVAYKVIRELAKGDGSLGMCKSKDIASSYRISSQPQLAADISAILRISEADAVLKSYHHLDGT